jgi:hypothetical protein
MVTLSRHPLEYEQRRCNKDRHKMHAAFRELSRIQEGALHQAPVGVVTENNYVIIPVQSVILSDIHAMEELVCDRIDGRKSKAH